MAAATLHKEKVSNKGRDGKVLSRPFFLVIAYNLIKLTDDGGVRLARSSQRTRVHQRRCTRKAGGSASAYRQVAGEAVVRWQEEAFLLRRTSSLNHQTHLQ